MKTKTKSLNLFERARAYTALGDQFISLRDKLDDEEIQHLLEDSTKHKSLQSKKIKKIPKNQDEETCIRELQVTVCLRNCTDCAHSDHSGAYTPGGAKQICGHSDAVKWATRDKQVNKKDKDDKYHWRHRVIRDYNKIPEWCPLKHGAGY